MQQRLILLADINSPHTQKWAISLANENFTIEIVSLTPPQTNWHTQVPGINVLFLGDKRTNAWFLLSLFRLIIHLYRNKPRLLHAHYASSYGLLGALTFFKPFVVSAWGSDITEFPKRSFLHNLTLRFVFFRANRISVTSHFLEQKIKQFSHKQISVIPFGVNLKEFYAHNNPNKHEFTFGFVKHLETIYNPEKTILAANALASKYPDSAIRLKLLGDGSLKQRLLSLSRHSNPNLVVEFYGNIAHSEVPSLLNEIDVLVNVSEYESFGVSVAEAMACKIPVIVSNHSGFRDLVPDKSYGVICNSTKLEDIITAMETTYLDKNNRQQIADKAYQRITQLFNWFESLKEMKALYAEITDGPK